MSVTDPQRDERNRFTTVLFYVFVAILAWLVYQIFDPFLVPLAWAAVLVVVFYPVHSRLERRLKPGQAAIVSTIALTLILIVPSLALMNAFINEGVSAAKSVQQAFAEGRVPHLRDFWAWIEQRLPAAARAEAAKADPIELARQGAEAVGIFLAARSGKLLGNVAGFLFSLFLTLFATFFFFRDRESLMSGIRRFLPFERVHREAMITQAAELIQASVTSSLIIGVVQGVLGMILFAVLGIPEALFWGVSIAFCALVPLLGSGVIIVPAAVWLFVTGETTKGLVMLGVGLGVIAMVDNFLRPILVSGRAQMSALLVFISVLGGISVFGMLGLVMGPLVVATASSVLKVYTPPDA